MRSDPEQSDRPSSGLDRIPSERASGQCPGGRPGPANGQHHFPGNHKSLYYQGRIQYNAANYRAAIVTYTEALELSNKAKDQTNGEVIHRAPAQIPLTCAFSEENSAITVVYFDDLGSASINIDNNSTGEECQYIVNAVTGVQRYLLR